MARRNIASYSDDEDDDNRSQASSPPPSSPVKRLQRRDSSDVDGVSEEDETESMADFLDDRALDELTENSDSAEEGFSDHEKLQRTPPSKPLPKKQYPVDTNDEGVAEASDFEADIVESPKKRIVKAAVRASNKSANDEDAESDSMDVSPAPKKRHAPATPGRKVHLIESSDSDEIEEIEKPVSVTAKQSPGKKGTSTAVATKKATPVKKKTPAKKKAVKSKEILSDTDDDAVAALKLENGDSMYPEKRPSKVQSNTLKRGAPITPPLATRSKSSSVQATPSKRQRTNAVDHAQDNSDDEGNASEVAPTTKTQKSRRAAAPRVKTEDVEVAMDHDATPRVSSRKASARTSKVPLRVDEDSDEQEETPKPPRKTKQDVRAPVVRKKAPVSEEDDAPVLESDEDALTKKKSRSVTSESRKKTASTVHNGGSDSEREHQAAPPNKKIARSSADDASEDRDHRSAQGKSPTKRPSPTTSENKPDDDRTDEALQEGARVKANMPSPGKLSAKKLVFPSIQGTSLFAYSSPKNAATSSSKSPQTTASDVFETRPEDLAPKPVVNQKYSSKVWVALPEPEICEVYDINLLDKVLSARKGYLGLKKLRSCDLINAGQLFTGMESGRIWPSAWNDHLDKPNFDALVQLLTLDFDGRYVNLSRVSPSAITARYMTDTRHEVAIDGRTAICFAPAAVRESALVGTLGTTFPYHALRVVFHTYEHERLSGVLGELSRRGELVTQIWNSAVTIGTKTATQAKKAKTENLPTSFYNTYQSPKKKRAVGASSLPDHIGALDFEDTIPVYDARCLPDGFKWGASVFDNPAQYFPLFPFDDFPEYGGEIPPNSLVNVGFVTQIYRMPDDSKGKGKGKGKDKDTDDTDPAELRVNFMLRFVFVLCVIN